MGDGLVVHLAEHLGPPIVEGGKDDDAHAAKHGVVEVGDDKG